MSRSGCRRCGRLLTATWALRCGGFAPGRSVTRGAPRSGGGLACHRDELPGIRAVVQRELQDAVYTADACLAVRDDEPVGALQSFSPGAHDDLTDAVHWIVRARRRLRREPLVVTHIPV